MVDTVADMRGERPLRATVRGTFLLLILVVLGWLVLSSNDLLALVASAAFLASCALATGRSSLPPALAMAVACGALGGLRAISGLGVLTALVWQWQAVCDSGAVLALLGVAVLTAAVGRRPWQEPGRRARRAIVVSAILAFGAGVAFLAFAGDFGGFLPLITPRQQTFAPFVLASFAAARFGLAGVFEVASGLLVYSYWAATRARDVRRVPTLKQGHRG